MSLVGMAVTESRLRTFEFCMEIFVIPNLGALVNILTRCGGKGRRMQIEKQGSAKYQKHNPKKRVGRDMGGDGMLCCFVFCLLSQGGKHAMKITFATQIHL